jgi:NAD(P)-dependent dehydrogenase (short-subunit alcohol dehydrogenase family)
MSLPDDNPLAGKTALVTGASRGIGLRIARALGEAGANVVLLARPSDHLDAAAAEMPDALAAPCDVSSADSVRAAFAQAVARFGRIDILINNAALCLLQAIEEATDEDIRREVETNLIGPVLTIREAIPHMRAAGGGDIVNISSESVRLPFPYLTLYAATKAGLETLSNGLRAELRPDRIRVTVLRSGHVSGGNIGVNWKPERIQPFYDAITKSGHLAFTGEAIAPEITARAIVDLLRLPREANVDLIELRAT